MKQEEDADRSDVDDTYDDEAARLNNADPRSAYSPGNCCCADDGNGGPTAASKAAKFQVVQKVSTPRIDDIVTVTKITKYTKRLLLMLDELRVETSADQKCRDAIIELIHVVQGFVKELEQQTDVSKPPTDKLLEMYDGYRKAYYCLRDQIGKDVTAAAGTTSEPPLDSTKYDGWSTPVDHCSSDESGSPWIKVHECPGVLDVTKDAACDNDMTSKGFCDVSYLSSNIADWMSTIKQYLCFCFPCYSPTLKSFNCNNSKNEKIK